MRAYPTAKEVPHRDTRKKLRKVIFEENKLSMRKARKERKKQNENSGS